VVWLLSCGIVKTEENRIDITHARANGLEAEIDKVSGQLWINGGFRELDRKGREERELRQASISRLQMAMFGGIALIIPMLIMALHSHLTVALVTTSVATVAFGIIIAFGARDSTGKDVLGATAAYAAVLVVFVGTSLAAASTSSSG
jgi:VIT1/CCC1 family predicted Fe2+/Mn2+ transporter